MTANGKRWIQVESFSKKQLKTIPTYGRKWRETTNLCVEIMNSKRQVEGETWSRGTNYRLPH